MTDSTLATQRRHKTIHSRLLVCVHQRSLAGQGRCKSSDVSNVMHVVGRWEHARTVRQVCPIHRLPEIAAVQKETSVGSVGCQQIADVMLVHSRSLGSQRRHETIHSRLLVCVHQCSLSCQAGRQPVHVALCVRVSGRRKRQRLALNLRPRG